MFFHDRELQREVTVDSPDPGFAKALQQAIGGIEGEIRVALQYMFQVFGARGPDADRRKYRDMLMETATEELGHIEMGSPKHRRDASPKGLRWTAGVNSPLPSNLAVRCST